MKYLKLFENHNQSCYMIDHDEFSKLCSLHVVDPDSSGETNFVRLENRYTLSLSNLLSIMEEQVNILFGKGKITKTNKFFDSMYGNFRSVELEVSVGRKNLRIDIHEITDEWFLGYFTLWPLDNVDGCEHKYFKCDQVSGLSNFSNELGDSIKEWIELKKDR